MSNLLLISWLGSKDIKASEVQSTTDIGPIAQALDFSPFQTIHLLSNYKNSDSENYVKWLSLRTSARIKLHIIRLTSPVNHGEIYERVIEVLDELKLHAEEKLTYHLSPGTPAMQSIWILLAKTTHPARMIQSSLEAGVEEANIPFDISAEFIPQLLQQSDERFTLLAQGITDDNVEFGSIIHRSLIMKRVISQAKRVAIRSIPVLIEGESGTGKELLARAIHRASLRAEKPLVIINCGAIPSELVESEFFGYKKGAFTGAISDRKGHFEQADGGTIFLDEIGELPKSMQVKLLRVLQEGEVTPVGASESKKINVRVLTATNRTLINEVAAGNFREDLFYRLAVAIIKLPPLRERGGDISLLTDSLLEQINDATKGLGIKHKKISVSARNVMLQHQWPGNIREMFNTLQRATLWSDDELIGEESIRDAILLLPKAQGTEDGILNKPLDATLDLEEILSQVARHYLRRGLESTNNNRTQAAKILGFSNYQTFSNWVKKYGID